MVPHAKFVRVSPQRAKNITPEYLLIPLTHRFIAGKVLSSAMFFSAQESSALGGAAAMFIFPASMVPRAKIVRISPQRVKLVHPHICLFLCSPLNRW